jgi:hypothetical protein
MNKLIQQLSPRAEFVIVTTTGFGYFTFTSLVWFLYILTAPADFSMPALSDTDLYSIVGYEIVALLLISNFLYLRGWSIRHFIGAGLLFHLLFSLDSR